MTDCSDASRPHVRFAEYSGIRATVMGLGDFGGGLAAAVFLAEHGARVTVSDLRRPEQMSAETLTHLNGLALEHLETGGHSEAAFRSCELLVVNPAVRPDHPLVVEAGKRGVRVTSEIGLFLQHNPAPVVAVTGSNGKSTTTALIHHLLNHCPDMDSVLSAHASTIPKSSVQSETRERRVWLGGNIGISLLPCLYDISAGDIVVLELSSFQLHLLGRHSFQPRIAVLTGFVPNHLDWHGSADHYQQSKQNIFESQQPGDVAIVPDTESLNAGFENNAIPDFSHQYSWGLRGRRQVFGLTDSGEDGAFLDSGHLILRTNRGTVEDVVRLSVPRQLPGIHNQMNIVAACCAAWHAGADPTAFPDALKNFRPLPHRLQCVAAAGGIEFWNDSIATTPESAIMALRLFSDRAILLAGGYDKGQDLTALAGAATEHARAVILMGQTAAKIRDLLTQTEHFFRGSIIMASGFEQAFDAAVKIAARGDVVLLSPGCASYGWFRDYRERGEFFVRMAKEWERRHGECATVDDEGRRNS